MTAPDVNAAVLLPCPFCGEAPAYKVWDNHNYHRAACEACNLEFDFYLSRDELVAAWNRRTAHADLSGEVRELVEAGNRSIAAFEALGKAFGVIATARTRQECEAALVAQKAALAKHTCQETK